MGFKWKILLAMDDEMGYPHFRKPPNGDLAKKNTDIPIRVLVDPRKMMV